MFKFFKSSYLHNHYSESFHIWYHWELAFIPWLLTPGSMPRMGLEVKKLGTFKSVFFFFHFSIMKRMYADSWSDIDGPCDIDLWVRKWRSLDLRFTVQWFCLISWRLWCMNIILCKGVTIYQYIIYCSIICRCKIPVRLMRIPVYRYTIAVPCFILVYLVLLIEGTAKIDCALSSLPTFTFPGVILLEPVRLQTCIFSTWSTAAKISVW